MPSYRTGEVVKLLEARRGLQRVEVDLGQGPARAYALPQLTGPVELGDRVVMNTTAVELGLGTGGWHVVHWNLERDAWSGPRAGHEMKLRYTSLQIDAGVTSERPPKLGMPVVACFLHSQVAMAAAACKRVPPTASIAYVMTDGGALPIAVSDLVPALRHRGLLDLT